MGRGVEHLQAPHPALQQRQNALDILGYLQRRGNPDASQYRYSPERLEAKYIIEPDNLQHDRIAWLDSLIMAMPESDLSHVYRTEIEARKERILNA